MQKGGGWVQIACKIAYVLNGRPLCHTKEMHIYTPMIEISICTDDILIAIHCNVIFSPLHFWMIESNRYILFVVMLPD